MWQNTIRQNTNMIKHKKTKKQKWQYTKKTKYKYDKTQKDKPQKWQYAKIKIQIWHKPQKQNTKWLNTTVCVKTLKDKILI